MEKAKAQVLRYLGRRGQEISPELDAMLEECMQLMLNAASPRNVSRTFDIRFEVDGISVENTSVFLHGADICHHLAGCGRVILLAATLGASADKLIRYWQSADLTRSLILDACSTQLIEQYCDEIEEQACREASADGFATAPRFSPGYGDLPLDIQPKLLSVLDAGKKIGLTCTESFILLPRKSVTALIGLGKDLPQKKSSCSNCALNETCSFRKGIDNNGYTAANQ